MQRTAIAWEKLLFWFYNHVGPVQANGVQLCDIKGNIFQLIF
jgi:hypothetical protein